VCQQAAADIKDGDVVYISNHNYLFRRVERDTKTWTSHVGVAFKNVKNEIFVYESTWPKSKITPLCDFVGRSFEYKVAVKRFSQALTAEQINAMKMTADDQLNLRYDHGFDYDDVKTSFCSKYVYNVFQAANIQIGHLETMRELLESNPDLDLIFWKAWYLGRIPYERNTITPASEYFDTKFNFIYTNNIVD
jgi:hypothetical protein